MGAELMRRFFYRKVVLSDSDSPGPAAAMLITGPRFGVPAFATAQGGGWRLAPSREGVEDAVHYNGKFHSITYAGAVEAWEQPANAGGVFASTAVAPRPRLPNADGDPSSCRKYLVVVPGGRLMVVLKESKEETTDKYSRPRRTCSFNVQVLDGEQWKETDDIGDAALFVGVNSSLYVSTREHPELRAGCIYYTENDTELCKDGHNADEDNRVGVYSLEVGWTEKVEGLGQHRSWPPPAWFIPAIP
ncbi:hypothetical protein CFC21_026859 [Triticum aestivum]|uniref:KIB1-4 beta-propeller domain-containing protein n=2 Tax=Triticum aestivum TaxID=4565 RepID=A0A9R1JDC5_WHEAT|nr:hypothetical protein CFC21_026859 [Triticum aestivum]